VKGRYTPLVYFSGSTLSRMGEEVSVPALLLLGLATSGSARTAAASYAALTLAAAIGGPVLGLVLDRARRPGTVLGSCLLLYGAGLGVITLAGDTLPGLLLVVLAACAGVFNPAVSGGWSSQLGAVPVGRQRGSALDVATYNVAGIAGPALAGLTATTLGAGPALGLAVVLVLAAVPAAMLLPTTAPPRRRSSGPVLRSLVVLLGEGFRPLVRIPALRGATVGSSISFAGLGMFVVACPLLGAFRLGDVGRGPLLITAVAAASLVATVCTARWPPPVPPDLVVLATTLLAGLGLVLTALADTAVPTVLAVLVIGFADGPQLAAVFAVRHRDAPSENRAQVFTTAVSLKIGSAASGAALAAVLVETSLAAVLLVAAALQLVAVVAAVLAGTPVRPQLEVHRR
jgi:MFS family permease